jgi:hypothetical protein
VPNTPISEFAPSFISFSESFPTDVVTADMWNELWTLVIAQGNEASGTLYEACQSLLYTQQFYSSEILRLEQELLNLSVGQIPEGSLTDIYLSDDANDIKARLSEHLLATGVDDPHPGYILDSEIAALITAHNNVTSPHSATSTATADRLMLRDSFGRARVAAPVDASDIARKDTVDAVANRTVTAGDGLTGGGALTNSITLTVGTPGTVTTTSTNATTATSHTHALAGVMPIAGGTFTGIAYAQSNATLTRQIRNVIFRTTAPGSGDGSDGDICIVYTA